MKDYIDVGFIQRCRHNCTINEIVFLNTIEAGRSHTLICSADRINIKYENYPRIKNYIISGNVKLLLLANVIPRLNRTFQQDVIENLSTDTLEVLVENFIIQYSYKVGTLKTIYEELFVMLGHRLIVHYLMYDRLNQQLLFDLAYYTNIEKMDGRGIRLYKLIDELIDYERELNRRKLLNTMP